MSIGSAIRRHFLLVLIPPVLLVAAALAYGLSRDPTYTAEAQLLVGSADVSSQAVPGFVLATQQLAGSYSRAVEAPSVLRPVAKRLQLPPEAVAEKVSSTPVPDSAVIVIEGSSKDKREAIDVANLTARGLVRFVGATNTTSPEDRELRRDQRRAEKALGAAAERRGRAASAEGQSTSPETQAALARAEADEEAARLRLQQLSSLIQARAAGQVETAGFIRLSGQARAAESDRNEVLQRVVLTAVLVGLLIGVALAVLRANAGVRAAANV